MRRSRHSIRPQHAEAGFTLVELLLVLILGLLLMSAALTAFVHLERQAAADIERAQAIRDAERGLHRMTRELRQAYTVTSRSADELQVRVRINGADVAVRYSCAQPHPTTAGLYRCVRFATQGGVTHQAVVVDRVLNAAPATPAAQRVFQYPNGRPSFVRAQIAVPARGEGTNRFNHRVVLDDGFYMRNCDATC
jgi:prepilin-type N-terminal cleavage/methylation domain-containing protein